MNTRSMKGANPMLLLLLNAPISRKGPDQTNWNNGLASDNIVTPADIPDLIRQMIIDSRRMAPTPLINAFSSESNMELVRQQIQNNLQEYMKQSVQFLLTSDFVNDVVELLVSNPGLSSYDVSSAVQYLNDILIDKETKLAILSDHHKTWYDKNVLQNDRPSLMPYGYADRTSLAKGDRQITCSGYALNHPDKSQYESFLQQVLGISKN